MQKRIYFCGAHCTGKTTLSKQLADREKCDLITEVVRSIPNAKERIFKARSSISEANRLQMDIFLSQQEAEDKCKGNVMVVDRFVDNLAYMAQIGTSLPDLINFGSVSEYLKRSENNRLVFFIRPCKELLQGIDDGFRSKENQDWDSIVRIDGAMMAILQILKIQHISISDKNLRDRWSTVCCATDLFLGRGCDGRSLDSGNTGVTGDHPSNFSQAG